jgi:hypothetical protein
VPGRKGGQYAQWSLVDGHIHVVSFSSGKKMSEWDEDAPVQINTSRGGEGLREVGYCAVKFESFGRKDDICVLGIGHEGPHENTSIGSREIEPDDEDGDDPLEEEVRSDADRDLARKMREEREAHARELEQAEPAEPSLTDLCPKCSKELGEHDGKKCPKPAKAKVSKIYTAAEREAIERKEAQAQRPGPERTAHEDRQLPRAPRGRAVPDDQDG